MENSNATATPQKRGWPKLVLAIVATIVISTVAGISMVAGQLASPSNPVLGLGIGG